MLRPPTPRLYINLVNIHSLSETQHGIHLNIQEVHQEINKSGHRKGICTRISASKKHVEAHGKAHHLVLMKENVHRGALL